MECQTTKKIIDLWITRNCNFKSRLNDTCIHEIKGPKSSETESITKTNSAIRPKQPRNRIILQFKSHKNRETNNIQMVELSQM